MLHTLIPRTHKLTSPFEGVTVLFRIQLDNFIKKFVCLTFKWVFVKPLHACLLQYADSHIGMAVWSVHVRWNYYLF